MQTKIKFLKEAALINGEWRQSDNKVNVLNPATNEVLGTVPNLGSKETVEAVKAAAAEFRSFRKTTAHQRAEWLWNWHRLIRENAEDLGLLLTLEQGKPLAESVGEVRFGASYVKWFAEEVVRPHGQMVPSHWPDKRILVHKAPVGVVGAITPWNFPSAMVTRKVSPALAAGCTVVLKPSELTPYSAIALGELALQAGFPKGAFHIVTGDPAPIGDVLCVSRQVRKFSFTGSTRVGKMLYARCADTVKKMSLELGGNAPFLVFDDADIERAVVGAIASKFRNAGQTCVCANRFLVQRGVAEEFAAAFKKAVEAMKVGNGTDDGVEQGPLINIAASDKVASLVTQAVGAGAQVLTGGKPHSLGGSFYEPTILMDAKPEMDVCSTEIFGPVAPIIVFDTEEEGIALANDTPYGLAAYAYTKDLGRAFRLSEELEYGMVGLNEGIVTAVQAPFGGVKESGLGREGGVQGLDEFLCCRYTLMGGV